mmetsp:Transcript_9855/g.28951  ORF Transcript_9855/g.28951 Transcript_9855/m.28951 type:complete len:386 (+) Transcript_9855:242-1399(+)
MALRVEPLAVLHHAHEVGKEHLAAAVVRWLLDEALADGAQIHGVRVHLEIVRVGHDVDGLREDVYRVVALDALKQVLKRRLQARAVALRIAPPRGHIHAPTDGLQRPARLAHARDVQRVLHALGGRQRRPSAGGLFVAILGLLREALVLDVRETSLLDALEDEGLLRLDHGHHGHVVNGRVDVALHERAAIVVLDVTVPALARHAHRFAEALLLEVPDGVVVRVSQEIPDALGLHVVLELVHHARAEPLHLLRRRDGAEGDLRDALLEHRAVADAAHDAIALEQRDAVVLPVEHEPHDVAPRHLRQLLREDALEVHERDQVLVQAIVRHNLAPELLLGRRGGAGLRRRARARLRADPAAAGGRARVHRRRRRGARTRVRRRRRCR